MQKVKAPDLITIKQAAEILVCSVDKVERLIRQQVFITYKPGGDYRIDRPSFLAWVQSTRFNPITQPKPHNDIHQGAA